MTLSSSSPTTRRVGHAWVALCAALALHVVDEALTDFLSVYNPIVRSVREAVPWSPLPVFEFRVWLTLLIVVVAVLFALSPLAYRGGRAIRALAYPFAVLMTLNGLAHFGGSLLLERPMPGVYSSPVLIVASLFLVVALRQSRAPP